MSVQRRKREYGREANQLQAAKWKLGKHVL